MKTIRAKSSDCQKLLERKTKMRSKRVRCDTNGTTSPDVCRETCCQCNTNVFTIRYSIDMRKKKKKQRTLLLRTNVGRRAVGRVRLHRAIARDGGGLQRVSLGARGTHYHRAPERACLHCWRTFGRHALCVPRSRFYRCKRSVFCTPPILRRKKVLNC